jgi:hypothetical protein
MRTLARILLLIAFTAMMFMVMSCGESVGPTCENHARYAYIDYAGIIAERHAGNLETTVSVACDETYYVIVFKDRSRRHTNNNTRKMLCATIGGEWCK